MAVESMYDHIVHCGNIVPGWELSQGRIVRVASPFLVECLEDPRTDGANSVGRRFKVGVSSKETLLCNVPGVEHACPVE